jgi:5-methylcytosine-specific restriction protein A
MVAWFSQQITTGVSPWTAFFDRERQGGTWAYRPKTAAPVPIAEDVDLSAIEGEPRLFFHLRRERSQALRKAKKDAERNAGKSLCCESCGLVTEHAFPGLTEDILEVHHRISLSDVEGTVVNTLDDLALLCPNCHRAIHRTKPMLSVEEFRKLVLHQTGDNAG